MYTQNSGIENKRLTTHSDHHAPVDVKYLNYKYGVNLVDGEMFILLYFCFKAVAVDHVDWVVESEERTDAHTHDAHQLEQLAGLMLSLTTKMQQLEEVGCNNF